MTALDRRTLLAALGTAAAAPRAYAQGSAAPSSHALSLYGDIKYPPAFTHFDYVNPGAPKGGQVKFASLGTFDNLNPFILKGVSFVGTASDFMQAGALFDTLMAGSADEPSTLYGLIAKSVELPDDRMSVTFTLDERARFHDGAPITVEDVLWTYETLLAKGHPLYRVVYADVAKVEPAGAGKVRFTFKNNTNRQIPLVAAALAPLPRHWWQGREFDQPTLDPLLGSSAYRIAEVQPGRSMVWERVKDYWAENLPSVRGTANFDRVQVDYYRDMTVQREAFKGGLIDIRQEFTAADWFTAYDFPAVKQGLVVKREVQHDVPEGMQSYVFNTRRPIFQDPRVRRALAFAYDFQWYNKTYFYNSYARTKSYFENSELAARGLPQGDELALLERYRGRVPDSVFTEAYDLPDYPDPTAFRNGLRQAFTLLKEAGWSYRDDRLVNDASGQPFEFEFMNDEPRLERTILPFLKNLERLGIKGTIRTVDAAQEAIRRRDYDFDMLAVRYGASLTPGNELRQFYTSQAADTPGSPNVFGIKDPVVDELVELIVNTETRPELLTRVHALDRVLLHGHYCIPNYYSGSYRVAYWDKYGIPAVQPTYVSGANGAVGAWWVDDRKGAVVAAEQERLEPQ